MILDLPRTFTRHIITADRNEIPRTDVICKIFHLEKISAEIPPCMANIEVGLLIGLNCPSALRPSEIVYGKKSDRVAHSSDGTSMVPSVLRNRVAKLHAIHVGQEDTLTAPRGYVVSQRMVKEQITPRAVRQMFELDFSEREKGTAIVTCRHQVL